MASRLNNKSGMIMVIVTMMVIVMSVVMVGLIRNFSFVLSTEEQLRRVEVEQVAKGGFWSAYQTLSSGGTVSTGDTYNETIDGRQYKVTYTIIPNAGPGSTNQIDVKVDY